MFHVLGVLPIHKFVHIYTYYLVYKDLKVAKYNRKLLYICFLRAVQIKIDRPRSNWLFTASA